MVDGLGDLGKGGCEPRRLARVQSRMSIALVRIRCIAAGLLASATTVVFAVPADDPLQSAACRRAVDALEAHERHLPAAAGAASAPAHARLRALRREASTTCLGAAPDRAPSRATRRPPIEIASPARGPAPRPAAVEVLPAVQRTAPPASITGCDATGCWASDGTRLQRLGTDLVGPRGVCSVQGTLLQCPPSR